MGFYQWLQLVNNLWSKWYFGHFLAIFSCLFGVFWLFFSIFCHFRGYSRQFFAWSFQFRGQLHWINNHIPSSLVSVEYSKCQSRHFACLYIYIFIFNPYFACSSWRDHYNDQGDQNWSLSWSKMLSFRDSYCIRY